MVTIAIWWFNVIRTHPIVCQSPLDVPLCISIPSALNHCIKKGVSTIISGVIVHVCLWPFISVEVWVVVLNTLVRAVFHHLRLDNFSQVLMRLILECKWDSWELLK